MVKFSYCHVPAYPLEESINIIKTADECGFYAAYSVDETWWKDMWLLFAAAADKTTQIRMGPNVTHVILRDPAHIVQMAATLDQLTNGRAEIVVSFGNISMLPQHGIDTTGMKPLSRVHRGARGDAHAPRHRRGDPRRRVLQAHRPVDAGAARPGAPADQARRHGRPAVVRGRRRAVRRRPPGDRHVARDLPVHGRQRQEGRREGRPQLRGPRPRRVAGDGGHGGLGRRQGDGADHGRVLPLGDARAAAQPPRRHRRRTSSRSSTRSAPATCRRRSS